MDQAGQVNAGFYEGIEKAGIPNGDIAEERTDLTLIVDPGGTDGKTHGNIQVQPAQAVYANKEQLEEVKEEELPPVGFFALFRHASCGDKLLMAVGTLVALVSGASMPAVMIIFGEVIDQLIGLDMSKQNHTSSNSSLPNGNTTTEKFLETTAMLCIWNAVVGVSVLIFNYIMVSFFSVAAANQAFRIRCRFMQAVLRQDMAWYDTHQTGDFAVRITGDLTRIQEGIGEKVAICISFLSATVLCVGCGLYYGWKLALVILSITPVMTIAMGITSKIQATVSTQETEAYGLAGAVAEEVISSIRTVVAFGGQKKEMERFEACLIPATKKGIKRGLLTSVGSALIWLCIFCGYALAFWYGVKLILEGRGDTDPEYTGGKLIIVFFNVMSASMFIGQTAPYFEAFALARGSAAKIYSIIEREPEIDSSSEAGHTPENLEGHIRLKEVHFTYPARDNVPVLKGLDLEAKPGETVALVGPSGCGKSTIVQLLLRFYDTKSGSVEVDGIDVKDLQLGWLRDQIGLVGQEPVLFSTSIEENIRMGREDATHEDIERAAKTANAHHFIMGLPKKYDTLVGERGTQLSGGQKQRIAIARALVRNPRILLLDEATSALDTESEAVVQAALDEARRGRTTVVVAHRLSTIRTADKIVVLNEGEAKERGTHEELMEAKGLYYHLVVSQVKEDESKEAVHEDEELPELERRVSLLSAASDDPPGYGQRPPSMFRQDSVLHRQFSTASTTGKEEDDVDAQSKLPRKRLMKMSAQDWPYILIGSICSMLMGAHFPAFGVIFGYIVGLLSQEAEVIEKENSFYCLLFVLMAVTSFTCNFLQIFMFSISGEKLTFRLRKMVFANIISQDMAFFDDVKNSVGSLCSRLNSDASSVQGATGSRISMAVQAMSTMAISIFIGLYFNWKIGLVVLAFVPLVLLSSALEAKVVSGQMHSDTKSMEDASKVATEAIDGIRTVASLHQEDTFYKKYRGSLVQPHKQSRLRSHVRGLAYGFAQSITSFVYASTMYYGSVLVARGDVTYADLLKILEGVLVGAMMVGQAVAFTPDYEKARVAVIRIFRLLDIRPTIDTFAEGGILKPTIDGSIDFSAVHFNYPSRPQFRVLRGLEASIKPGQTVALVGSSGCGKSTCVQLLERFYDPSKGKVTIDSEDIRDLNVSNHRSHLALVSQEPVLFAGSVADNIAYGDNSRKPTMAEIIEVSRQANIHSFVSSLPQGYDTPVGGRGTQMSGGQKQRIAIARALLRNPRVLLLDEATSALDTESEKVVQEALDQARSGRTCVVIAHRLTTVQNADVILVLQRGKIVERGTHQELIQRKGVYYGLHNT